MTLEIALVLGILLAALVAFITEKIRMDVTALLVLVALAFTGVITPNEAISGFANPAVITVWAMFILSEGLSQTGIANMIGTQVLRFTGKTEMRMIIVIMMTAGGLSALMNNIGVAALMLPVVLNLARSTGIYPSKLLMPLAYGSLLGGLTTLIGTPPNLLISEALVAAGEEGFGLFDFTPIGLTVMTCGVLFVAFSSRWLLPANESQKISPPEKDVAQLYREYTLGEQSFIATLKPDSSLIGATLEETRLGRALGLRVFALQREGQTILSPKANYTLQQGDSLFLHGKTAHLDELKAWNDLIPESGDGTAAASFDSDNTLAQATLSPDSELVGGTLADADFRKRYGLNVLSIKSGSSSRASNIANTALAAGDLLLVQGPATRIEALRELAEFASVVPATDKIQERFRSLSLRLFEVSVPPGSWLEGRSLADSQLGGSFDLHILEIKRAGSEPLLVPPASEVLQAGDRLTLHGKREALEIIRGLQQLELRCPEPEELEALNREEIALVEATLSPKSIHVGKTPSEIRFAERFGIQLLGINRGGETLRSNLARERLRFGDSLLFIGTPQALGRFEEEPDIIPLTHVRTKTTRNEKALTSAIIMIAVLVPVFLGWFPIAITAIAGATLMVLTNCLRMEDAYRAIQWNAVFLIAGMLPLGLAIERSGAATLLSEGILATVGGHGPWIVIGTLYLITAVATTIIPTAALVVLMTPIVLTSCEQLGIPPQTAMMAVAMAASASFTSPISHPANILVMGPGGYRFVDYIKVGAPLAFVIFVVTMVALPFFWPL